MSAYQEKDTLVRWKIVNTYNFKIWYTLPYLSLVSVVIQLSNNAARKTSQGRTADPNHGPRGAWRGVRTRVLYLSFQGQHPVHDVSGTRFWFWLKITILTCSLYILHKQLPLPAVIYQLICVHFWGEGGLHVANFFF